MLLQVTHVEGVGTITGNNEVTVAGSDGSSKLISAKNILIATGSVPIPFPGLEVGLVGGGCGLEVLWFSPSVV